MSDRRAQFSGVLFLWIFCTGVVTTPAVAEPCNGDFDGDGQVTVDEIVVSIGNALTGCVAPTPAATPTEAAPTCRSSDLALAAGVTLACLDGDPNARIEGCRRVHLQGDCPIGRACAAATAHCSCVGGPLNGEPSACHFMTIPGGIRCGGICTGDCIISIEAS